MEENDDQLTATKEADPNMLLKRTDFPLRYSSELKVGDFMFHESGSMSSRYTVMIREKWARHPKKETRKRYISQYTIWEVIEIKARALILKELNSNKLTYKVSKNALRENSNQELKEVQFRLVDKDLLYLFLPKSNPA